MPTKKALDTCCYCPNLCRHACPVADADKDEMSTPRAKMATQKLLASQGLPWSKEAALYAYNCSHCGSSTGACELDNPVPAVLDQFRAKAYKKGYAPDSIYKYCQKFKRRNNPYGIRLLEHLKKRLPLNRFDPAGVTFFPGCTAIYRNPDLLRHTFELFDKLGVKTAGVFDQAIQCCGYPLLSAGDLEGFKEHAEVLSHMMDDYPLIVGADPACVFTLRELYPAYGFPMRSRFLTLVEFLDDQMAQSNFHIRKGIQTKVAYHDPCYLGRYLNVYEAPRRMLKTVIGEEPLEFRRCRDKSYCCGGGALLPVARPQTAETIIKNRLKEFEETGAKILLSACTVCENRFRRYGEKIQVKNIVEFINAAIEPKLPEKLRDELGDK